MKPYDVIIIGSGIGGLSSALTLINHHKRVLVLEQHNLPGGCSSSFVRGRFEFDASLHELCGLGEPGKWGYTGQLLMEDYKLPIKWHYSDEVFRVKATARSGKCYDVTLPVGKEAFIDAMEEAVPGSRKPLEEYFSIAEECYQASQYFDRHMFDKKKHDGRVSISAIAFLKRYFRYLLVAERPFNQVMRRLKMPEDAIDILNTYWVYLGANLEESSFTAMGTMLYCYVTMKPAIPHHTSHALSVEAIEKIRQAGSDVFMNVKATKIVADEKGNIQGVETSVGFFPCKHVIANTSPLTAYGQLLDKRVKVSKRIKKLLNAVPLSTRLFNVYLGLNKSPEELGIVNYTVFLPGSLNAADNMEESYSMHRIARCTATCYNMIYPDCSPKGTTILTLTIPFSDDSWANINQRDYVKEKERIAEEAIAIYEEQLDIQIRPYIEEIEIATPWTFAHYLGTPQGSIYGDSNDQWNSMNTQLLGIRLDQPIYGFKTVGASGARGNGYSQSYASGRDIANLTLEEMEGRKRHGK